MSIKTELLIFLYKLTHSVFCASINDSHKPNHKYLFHVWSLPLSLVTFLSSHHLSSSLGDVYCSPLHYYVPHLGLHCFSSAVLQCYPFQFIHYPIIKGILAGGGVGAEGNLIVSLHLKLLHDFYFSCNNANSLWSVCHSSASQTI